MKKIQLILLSTLFIMILSCQQQTPSQEPSSGNPSDKADLVTYSIEVKGMTCTGCENTVQNSVAELEGILKVTASHTDSTALVEFDAMQTSLSKITEAIEKKGYEVGEMSLKKAE